MRRRLLASLSNRQFLLLAGGGVSVLITALMSLLLLPQIRQLNELQQSYEKLQAAAANPQLMEVQNMQLQGAIGSLRGQLDGDAASLPAQQLEAYIVGRMQTISWRNKVELISIEPQIGEQVQNFQESLFRVSLHGAYFDLVSWLADVDDELGFTVIKDYEMQRNDNNRVDPQLQAELTIASYRASE